MNWKRWTICLLRGHTWNKLPYQGHEDTGFFVRCRTCGYENHDGTSIRPTAI